MQLRSTCFALLLSSACAVGAGTGDVKSDRLYVENCWDGKFDLRPDFFAANPFLQKSLTIRIQRGDNLEEQSDGLLVLVNDLQSLRAQLAKAPSTGLNVDVGLPAGVSPPGVPIMLNLNPPPVSLSLYLNNSCHDADPVIYSTAGQITFFSLFSGDPNESNAEDRLTNAEFSATFSDPRQPVTDPQNAAMYESTVTGNFRFYFQQGQPAQPFQ